MFTGVGVGVATTGVAVAVAVGVGVAIIGVAVAVAVAVAVGTGVATVAVTPSPFKERLSSLHVHPLFKKYPTVKVSLIIPVYVGANFMFKVHVLEAASAKPVF